MGVLPDASQLNSDFVAFYAPGSGCAIRVVRTPQVGALEERGVSEPLPHATSVNTRAFRACAAVALQAGGTRYRAALLMRLMHALRATP